MKEINTRVAICRRINGIRQEDVANYLGIKCSTYSQMEREGIISCEKLIKIAEFLKVDIRYLLYGSEYKEPKTEIPEKKPEPPEIKPHHPDITLSKQEYNFLTIVRYLSKEQQNFVMQLSADLYNKERKAINLFEENKK